MTRTQPPPKAGPQPALATGPAIDFSMPRSLQRALQSALANHASGEIVFAHNATNAVAITYTALWNSALCMLQGMQTLGCKTGDVLIIDAGSPADFIPALWATLLGGMVAVPLASSRWNAQAHLEFKDRLDKIRANLGQPLTLADDEDLFGCAGKRLVSFRQLGENPPTEAVASTDWLTPAVLVSTSGTTGHPQLVTLSGKALMHRWWPAGPAAPNQTRFLNWMPLDHVMGLGGAAPNAQFKIQLAAESFVQNPHTWLDLIQTHGITHAGMTNFGMKLIVDTATPSSWDLSSLKRVGVGTEMISEQMCARFVDTLVRNGAPTDAVILGYGLSECGPVAGGRRAFRPAPHPGNHAPPMIDSPTQGHSVRIVDDDGWPCQENVSGRIEVCGPTMTSGYFGQPEADKLIFTADGWLRTGDTGYLSGGCLCVTGREKEVILINSLKFSCAEIDAAILAIPGISLAHVFPWSDDKGQTERPALVYATDASHVDPACAESQIRKVCADRFGFGLTRCVPIDPAQVPRTRSGKVQRAQLAKAFMQAVSPHSAIPEPASPESLQNRVAALMASFLDGVTPGLTDNFFELGGDSLSALTFTVALEQTFKVSLPPATFTRAPTLQDVLTFIQAEHPPPSRLAIVPVQTGTSTMSLFIAPGVWGNIGYAHNMARDMGPEFTVATFQLTDPGDWESRFHSIPELAEECCALMRSAQPQGPYHLAGHSFGGMVAFEMGRQLLAAGLQVGTLSVIDSLAKLEQRDFAVDRTTHAADVIDHHRLLSKLYLPGTIEGPIRYFRARESVYLPLSDKTGGWSYLSRQGVEVIDIPGDHQSIVKGSSLGLLSRHVAAGLRGNTGTRHPHLAIPDAARIAIEAARHACLDGDAPREIALLRRAISLEPGIPAWVYTRLAQALFASGKIQGATQAYINAVKKDPWPLTTHFRLRETLKEYKSSKIARHVLDLARQMAVDSPATARITGTLCMKLGDVAEAEKRLRTGLEQTPESQELRLQLLRHLVRRGRVAEAEEQLAMALAYPIANDVAYQSLGKIAIELNRADLATDCLQKSLAIDPGNAIALAMLEQMQADKGEVESARNLKSRLDKLAQSQKFRHG